MSELWGFAAGIQQGTEENQRTQLFGLTMAEGQQKLAEGTLSIQEKEIAVKTAQRTLDQQDALIKLMNNPSKAKGGSGAAADSGMTDSTRDQSGLLFDLADAEFKVGRFKEAEETMGKASTIAENNSKIQARIAAQEKQKWTNVSDLLGSATDAKGWDRARQLFTTMHPEDAKIPSVQQVLQMPYSPQLVKALTDAVTDARTKSQIAASTASAVNSAAKAKESNFRINTLMPAQAAAATARAGALKRVGADKLNPKPTDINEIVKQVTKYFPQAEPNDLYTFSREVAMKALYYEKGHDHMTRPAAQDRAVQEALRDKHYAGLPMRGQQKIGSTEGNPLPPPKPPDDWSTMPADKKSEWAKKNMKINQYYQTGMTKFKDSDGIAVWDGSQYVAPENLDNEPALDLGDVEEVDGPDGEAS